MNTIAYLAASLVALSVATAAPAASVCAEAAKPQASEPASTATLLRQVNDWVGRINSADDATYVRSINELGPSQPGNAEKWLQFRNFLRGMEVCGVKAVNPDLVELWVFDPALDGFGIWRFKPAPSQADKPQFLGGSFTDDSPPGFVRPKLALPDLIQAIEARAASRAAADQFSGAVLVAKDGKVLFQKAFGLADREGHKPNTLDTQFRFGSMGKMFTAVALMQLVEQGKVNLDDPVGRYLKDFRNKDLATKVTVAHLLSHTGGTGNIFGPEFDRNKGALRSTQDYIDLYGARAAEFEPGAKEEYSNFGFILLGGIVEAVSGLSYDEYIQRNIFDPAGMRSTGNRPESEILPRRAVGYTGMGAARKSAADSLPLNGTAAGGGYSTVGDFKRFADGLTSHRLLRRETLQKLIDGGVKKADGEFAGFDFGKALPDAGRFIGHGGGAPGMNGMLQHFLDSGITIVVLANQDFPAADAISAFAAHRLPAK